MFVPADEVSSRNRLMAMDYFVSSRDNEVLYGHFGRDEFAQAYALYQSIKDARLTRLDEDGARLGARVGNAITTSAMRNTRKYKIHRNIFIGWTADHVRHSYMLSKHEQDIVLPSRSFVHVTSSYLHLYPGNRVYCWGEQARVAIEREKREKALSKKFAELRKVAVQ